MSGANFGAIPKWANSRNQPRSLPLLRCGPRTHRAGTELKKCLYVRAFGATLERLHLIGSTKLYLISTVGQKTADLITVL